ncbi:MAG: LPS export ABC transporter ATP-binding protein [Candidatus Hydrogenedentes bacterium]|nr:LPS export ABC transporter ATP-binding protein [Candidatus Hydrogenedentota bacterium]
MSDSKNALLYTDGLEKSFKKRKVVRGVSLAVNPGEIVGLLGPNGAGKTTTFSMTVGLLRPDAGRIFYDGKDITKLPMYRRAQAGIAYLPQEASVFRQLTVRQNVMAILEYQKLSKAERNKRVDELLDELNIAHLAQSPAYTLSGGERRRTEIARALVTRPKVFMLDEPFAGIDPIAVADLQEMMVQLKNKGIGVLITDHNVRETLGISDRAYMIIEGEVRVSGTPETIINDPTARKYYLGDQFQMADQAG